MSDKCEWKEGKRIYCNDARHSLPSIDDHFCRFCGGFIREDPEEKPDKVYLYINNEKFVIDMDDTAEKVEKDIAEIITRETGMLASVKLQEQS